ncbi:MAG: sulfotransferase [Desulfobacterales bacterium]
MPKPNFLLIGAQKSATTSISVMLSNHPDVFVVKGKEPHFFSENRQYARGWDWYKSLFSDHAGESAIIDASTSYSRTKTYPNTRSRIIKHIPDTKILYSVRHPLDRMESAYVEWMSMPSFLSTNTSINDMVRKKPNIIESTRYWKNISAYRKHFPDHRIKIIWFDEYVNNPDVVLADLFEFIGVDPSITIPYSHLPIASRKSRIKKMKISGRTTSVDTTWDRLTLQWIIEQLGNDTRKFLEWCGKPADYWRIDLRGKTYHSNK